MALSIAIHRGVALVEPTLPELLPELQYEQVTFQAGGPCGYTRAIATRQLYTFDFRNRLVIPSGLVGSLSERAAELGFDVVITDERRFGEQHVPCAKFRQTLSPSDRTVADALVAQPLGQIVVTDDAQLLDRIILAYRLFPDADVMVAVATRRRAWWFWNRMQQILREPIGLITSGSRRAKGRCTVVTFKYIRTFQSGQIHLLLLPDAADAAGAHAREMIANLTLPAIRVYAFLQAQYQPELADMLMVEAIAGRVIHSSVAPVRPVQVVIADGRDGRHLAARLCPVGKVIRERM